jgi:hypothetical protein
MSGLNLPPGIYQLEKILERLDSIDDTLKEILKELKKEKSENKNSMIKPFSVYERFNVCVSHCITPICFNIPTWS